MTEQLSPDDRQALELLRSSRAARDQETWDAAQASIDVERKLEEQTSVASTLKEEAVALWTRMLELRERPGSRRWLGGQATKGIVCVVEELDSKRIERADYFRNPSMTSLHTPILLPTNPEFIGMDAVIQGWMFAIDLGSPPSKSGQFTAHPDEAIAIYHVDSDLIDEKPRLRQAYEISWGRRVDDTSLVRVESDEINAERERLSRERYTELKMLFPELIEHYDHWKGRHQDDLRDLFFDLVLPHDRQEESSSYSAKDYPEFANLTKVKWWLTTNFPMPDKFLEFPLGLIIQARRELGHKKARKR